MREDPSNRRRDAKDGKNPPDEAAARVFPVRRRPSPLTRTGQVLMLLCVAIMAETPPTWSRNCSNSA